jgi:hypothetical protein
LVISESEKAEKMSVYLDKQVEYFEKMLVQIDAEPKERHKEILRTYGAHAAGELAGYVDRLFADDMMVEVPVYKQRGMGIDGYVEYVGKEDVRKAFYDHLNEMVVVIYDQDVAVADWGIAFFCTVGLRMTPEQLAAAGHSVPDSSKNYLVEYPMAERWPFDERARLGGEEQYQIGPTQITKLGAEDDFTIESRNEAVAKYLNAFRPIDGP